MNVKERIQDAVLTFLKWVAVTVGGFLYWMAVLLLASIFLMNIWKTTFEDILYYVLILTTATSAVYGAVLIYRKFK